MQKVRNPCSVVWESSKLRFKKYLYHTLLSILKKKMNTDRELEKRFKIDAFGVLSINFYWPLLWEEANKS